MLDPKKNWSNEDKYNFIFDICETAVSFQLHESQKNKY